jgi:hypothetical protein
VGAWGRGALGQGAAPVQARGRERPLPTLWVLSQAAWQGPPPPAARVQGLGPDRPAPSKLPVELPAPLPSRCLLPHLPLSVEGLPAPSPHPALGPATGAPSPLRPRAPTSCRSPSVTARTPNLVAAKKLPPAAASGMRWPDSPTMFIMCPHSPRRRMSRTASRATMQLPSRLVDTISTQLAVLPSNRLASLRVRRREEGGGHGNSRPGWGAAWLLSCRGGHGTAPGPAPARAPLCAPAPPPSLPRQPRVVDKNVDAAARPALEHDAGQGLGGGGVAAALTVGREPAPLGLGVGRGPAPLGLGVGRGPAPLGLGVGRGQAGARCAVWGGGLLPCTFCAALGGAAASHRLLARPRGHLRRPLHRMAQLWQGAHATRGPSSKRPHSPAGPARSPQACTPAPQPPWSRRTPLGGSPPRPCPPRSPACDSGAPAAAPAAARPRPRAGLREGGARARARCNRESLGFELCAHPQFDLGPAGGAARGAGALAANRGRRAAGAGRRAVLGWRGCPGPSD